MDIFILNENLQRIKNVSKFESLQWISNFYTTGEFILSCPISYFSYLYVEDPLVDRFLENTQDKEHIGVITSVEKITDDNGNKSLEVKGKFAESLLERRVIIADSTYEGKNVLETLNNEYKKIQTDIKRKISILADEIDIEEGIKGVDITDESVMLSTSVQYSLGSVFSDELYNKLKPYGLSYKLKWKQIEGNELTNLIDVQIYGGKNLSIEQDINERIIIEQRRGTAVSINYYKDKENVRNFAYLVNEKKEQSSRFITETEMTGLKRREVFMDMSSVSQTIQDKDGTNYIVSDEDFYKMVDNEVVSELNGYVESESVEAEPPQWLLNNFRTKYNIGDIISVKDNELNYFEDKRITAATETWSNSGYTISLTLGEDIITNSTIVTSSNINTVTNNSKSINTKISSSDYQFLQQIINGGTAEDLSDKITFKNGWGVGIYEEALQIWKVGFLVFVNGLVVTGTGAKNTVIFEWPDGLTPVGNVTYIYGIMSGLGAKTTYYPNYVNMMRRISGKYCLKLDNNLSLVPPDKQDVAMMLNGLVFAKWEDEDVGTMPFGATMQVVESGETGVDRTYVHSQNTASNNWTINHNLGKYPAVSVVDSANSVVEGNVIYTSQNQCVVQFKNTFSGKAYCN